MKNDWHPERQDLMCPHYQLPDSLLTNLILIMNNSVKILLALLGLAAMALSSCNTMAGFGRDMQSAGETINDKAQQ